MSKIIDLKSLGISQDLKEIKGSKKKEAALASAIASIRKEGKERIKRINEPYRQEQERTKRTFEKVKDVSNTKQNTLKQLKEKYGKLGLIDKAQSNIPSKLKSNQRGLEAAQKNLREQYVE